MVERGLELLMTRSDDRLLGARKMIFGFAASEIG
jgi:hypothetical protein